MDTIEERAHKAYELAYRYEQVQGHCPQASLAAIMEVMGTVDETLFTAADGLTAGTALSAKGTCGALAGGILAISRITGRDYQGFKENGEGFKWDEMIELTNRFKEKYGTILCGSVQEKLFGHSFNFLDPDDGQRFVEEGGHVDKCPSVCGDVAKWTVEIIFRIKD